MQYVRLVPITVLISILSLSALAQTDPGVRGGQPGVGGYVDGLDAQSLTAVQNGQGRSKELDGVADGLGPRFNADSCAACHAHPTIGGSSPPQNPLQAIATANGATNSLPSFITDDGPVREMRYISDGAVHALFVITGRDDALGCSIAQPDFDTQIKKWQRESSHSNPDLWFGAGGKHARPDG